MKKITFLFLVFCLSTNIFSQQKGAYDIEYTTINGYKIILPTLNNTFKIAQNLDAIMDSYNYKWEDYTKGYVKQNGAGEPYIFIQREYKNITFVWTQCSLDTSIIRKECEPFFNKRILNGATVYTRWSNDGSGMEITIKEYQNEGFVLVKLL